MERWYKASEDRYYVRCACWRHLIQLDGKGSATAPANGWYPATALYPHAISCRVMRGSLIMNEAIIMREVRQ